MQENMSLENMILIANLLCEDLSDTLKTYEKNMSILEENASDTMKQENKKIILNKIDTLCNHLTALKYLL